MAEKTYTPKWDYYEEVHLKNQEWYHTTGQILGHIVFPDGTVGYWVSFPFNHAAGTPGVSRGAYGEYELVSAKGDK